jgi:acyl-coenzyme A thioesterase PaaI-like protein
MKITEDRFKVEEHTGCVVCGVDNTAGFQITYTIETAGTVTAQWAPTTRYEGFKGLIHGGILATVLDEAMAKAVVSLGLEALTAELKVRYRCYVKADEQLLITGRIMSHKNRLLKLEASLCRNSGYECVHAWGTFIIVPGASTNIKTTKTKRCKLLFSDKPDIA